MSSQLGRRRAWARREERSRQLMRRARRIEVLVIRVLTALAQRGRSPHAELDAGRALSELVNVEGVSLAEVVRLFRGELTRAEVERLKTLARPQCDVRRSSAESPRLLGMTANRDELIHLIEGLPDDQVEVVLADVRRLASERPRGEWPPAFFGAGVAKDGRTDIARNVDEYLAEGFGSRRS
ncbi:hypothetical protein [Nocardioides ferulae]|uniref:hypothetical protein n=1 Tax=Nocardioides ferulae TaxID=2340821 RepID=UPI00197D69CF|nr:hypothetical protein [Nocardioides ferulae]